MKKMKQMALFMSAAVLSALLLSACATAGKMEEKKAETVKKISLIRLGVYNSGAGFDEGGAEIAAYDKKSRRLYSTNGKTGKIDMIDISDPSSPVLVKSLSPSENQKGAKAANSVAFKNGILAAAVENREDGENGFALFYDAEGRFLKSVETGVLPDMITITPDGHYAVMALEAEPFVDGDDKINDPEGGVALINLETWSLEIAGFSQAGVFNRDSVRTPLADHLKHPAYLDFEPEYIAVSHDSRTAYAGMQENNAVAVIDIKTASVKGIYGLGFKDHSLEGNGLDANKKDGIHITTAPLKSLFLPDSISAYRARDGKTYLLTANEGDDRELEDSKGHVIYADLGDMDTLTGDDLAASCKLNPADYPGKEFLADMGLTPEGTYEQLYVGGARSFSIWDADNGMKQVYDSGDDFEQYIAAHYPDVFNCSDDNLKQDNRSDDGGPDPEGLTVGRIDNRDYAFIAMEKFGGVFVYDITDPEQPVLMTYATGRNLEADVNEDREYEDDSYENTGDIAPEGLLFIAPSDSPSGKALLTVSNEVSGTIEIYEIR